MKTVLLSLALAAAFVGQEAVAAKTVTVKTARESVTVDLKGAKVLSYVRDGEEILADPRSPEMARWKDHGGIPLCWPWFGSGGPDPAVKHGFIRTIPFGVSRRAESAAEAELVLTARSAGARGAFPDHAVDLELAIALKDGLTLRLTTVNRGAADFRYTAGFHPYFAVKDPRQTSVDDLAGLRFSNTLRGIRDFRETWVGPLRFEMAYDHVFDEGRPGARHAIVDRAGGRTILVESPEAPRTVVWYVPDGRSFLCVEPVICWQEKAVTLRPGESHALSMRLSAQPLHK